MRRKIHFPAQNGVRQFMRAGRPYCLSHGGNVAAGRHAKTPNVSPAHRRALRATVCGADAPQINRRVGASFCSLGRQNLFGSPRPARFPLGETLAGGFGRRKLAISVKLNLLASRHG
ncbi:hypothetical protein ACIPTP_16545 [Pectobacterium versatile]|uniref:hypothetical protein n=1 Tax=Pectobacterium versatile TaxID=2488639 RepID=UPI00380332DA